MKETIKTERRVVVIYWKQKMINPLEVFSNLKNLCLSYPQYNYNTLNNYLSKNKMAYENENVRIERAKILTSPKALPVQRKMQTVATQRPLKEYDEKMEDLLYWLSRPVEERLRAVTAIISQSLKKGQRMDKTFIHQKKLRE